MFSSAHNHFPCFTYTPNFTVDDSLSDNDIQNLFHECKNIMGNLKKTPWLCSN